MVWLPLLVPRSKPGWGYAQQCVELWPPSIAVNGGLHRARLCEMGFVVCCDLVG